MKTRYKIIIIVCLSFIQISLFFPQVFWIFHLDKYETSNICDKFEGDWDWFHDTCGSMNHSDSAFNHDQICEKVGGSPTCIPCSAEEEWNPWNSISSGGCLDMCISTCKLDNPNFFKVAFDQND